MSLTELEIEKLYSNLNRLDCKNVEGLVDKNDSMSASIFLRAAKSVKTKEEFVAFIMNCELPPIKLSHEEMELVRGGAWWSNAAKFAYRWAAEQCANYGLNEVFG